MVHVTRNRNSGGNRRVVVQVHAAPLTDGDITAIDGVPVTSLARTVLDLCRTLPIEQAVAAGDRALVLGLVRAVLEERLAQRPGGPEHGRRGRLSRFLTLEVRARVSQ